MKKLDKNLQNLYFLYLNANTETYKEDIIQQILLYEKPVLLNLNTKLEQIYPTDSYERLQLIYRQSIIDYKQQNNRSLRGFFKHRVAQYIYTCKKNKTKQKETVTILTKSKFANSIKNISKNYSTPKIVQNLYIKYLSATTYQDKVTAITNILKYEQPYILALNNFLQPLYNKDITEKLNIFYTKKILKYDINCGKTLRGYFNDRLSSIVYQKETYVKKSEQQKVD